MNGKVLIGNLAHPAPAEGQPFGLIAGAEASAWCNIQRAVKFRF